MNFYQEVGLLVMGSRLKKTGEKFIQEVSSIYKACGIHFEIAWFPFFYLLEKQGQISISDFSESLNITHSACSQMVMQLQKKGFVISKPSLKDARKKDVTLTESGQELTIKIRPIWHALSQALENDFLDAQEWDQFLKILHSLEHKLDDSVLFNSAQQLIMLENDHIEYCHMSFNNELSKFIQSHGIETKDEHKFWVARSDKHILACCIYSQANCQINISSFIVAPAYDDTEIRKESLERLATAESCSKFNVMCRSKQLLSALLGTNFTFTVL